MLLDFWLFGFWILDFKFRGARNVIKTQVHYKTMHFCRILTAAYQKHMPWNMSPAFISKSSYHLIFGYHVYTSFSSKWCATGQLLYPYRTTPELSFPQENILCHSDAHLRKQLEPYDPKCSQLESRSRTKVWTTHRLRFSLVAIFEEG